MKEYIAKLNNEQREAATSIDGRVMILAGAGSGKTATLVARVAHMIDSGIPANKILLLTFTNKAAKEMRDRIAALVGKDLSSAITATTFHSFCAAFVRRNAHLISLPHNFTILDGPDTKDTIEIARQEFLSQQKSKGIEYDLKKFPKVGLLCELFSNAINMYCGLKKLLDLTDDEDFKEEIIEIHKKYFEFKEARGLVDYDDLLFYTIEILNQNERIRAALDEQYEYVSCDEYQDTNTIQNAILDAITKDYSNLAVVGDDNQSIYGWRSADIYNILNFDKRYPDCKKIILFENYRSSQEILDVANAVMENAKEGIPKKLHGQFSCEKPKILFPKDSFEEKDYVCEEIKKLHERGMKYNDMAVIIRASRQSTLIEAELSLQGIPYKKFGGLKFLERTAVKDILAFLRIMTNDKDELAWFRILQLYPGIGKTYAKKISAKIASEGSDVLNTIYPKKTFAKYLKKLKQTITAHEYDSLTTFLDFIINDYYPNVRRDCISQQKIDDEKKDDYIYDLNEDVGMAKLLVVMAEKYDSAEDFLADLVLDATVEEDESEDFVNITTVHSAKGLEYETVFFLDLIEGITPSCEEDSYEDPEELRVFYVAITRAKKYLYLFVPKKFLLGPTISPTSCTHFLTHQNVYDALGIDGVPNQSYNCIKSSFFY